MEKSACHRWLIRLKKSLNDNSDLYAIVDKMLGNELNNPAGERRRLNFGKLRG